MSETEFRQRLASLMPGESLSVALADIAQIAPMIPEEDEYAYAEQVRERIRQLCAEFKLYSLELDQEGPVEDPVDFRKVNTPTEAEQIAE